MRGVTKHGAASGGKVTPEYKTWHGIRSRCKCPTATKYSDYGGRGISVCDRWDSSFENFLADMGPRPSSRHSIDRIDVNGNYEPDNCRWTTPDVQGANQRSNVMLTVGGETHHLTEWARRSGLPVLTLWQRIKTLGWTHERAVKEPSGESMRRFYEVNGERLHVAELARRHGIGKATLSRRLRNGWDINKALTEPVRKPVKATKENDDGTK